MNINAVKLKISKLLRLQTSNNSGEAANAAAKVEQLCQKYGVSADDSKDYDPDVDEVIELSFGNSYKKTDAATNYLIGSVVRYFNGKSLIKPLSNGRKIMIIIASKGNQIQSELYLDYLLKTMNKLADEAKKSGCWGSKSRTYKSNWKKGFACRVADRLVAMKNEQKRVGKPDLNQPALVVLNKNAREEKAALAFQNEKYPRLRKGGSFRASGLGYQHGKKAGDSVGLNKQTGASKQTLALTGN
tara:strand:- start:17 stop:748 length:732 start_codon:yes stop_codon:yes gene_type:complete